MMQPMPRVPPFDRPATYDDLAKLTDNLVAEIVAGELHATPRPAAPHTIAASVLGGRRVPPFHLGRGGPDVETQKNTYEITVTELARLNDEPAKLK